METSKDYWYYLGLLEAGRWYDLRAIHAKLLKVCEGFDTEFIKWVATLVVCATDYWVDTDNMTIQRLKSTNK